MRNKRKNQSNPDEINIFPVGSKHLRVSKDLVQYFKSFSTAALLQEIIDKFKYFNGKKQLYEGEWFFLTDEKLSKNMFWTKSKVREIRRFLIADGIIECEMKRSPAKLHYKVNHQYLRNELILSMDPNSDFKEERSKKVDRIREKIKAEKQKNKEQKNNVSIIENDKSNIIENDKSYNNTRENNIILSLLHKDYKDSDESLNSEDIILEDNLPKKKYNRVQRPAPNTSRKKQSSKPSRDQRTNIFLDTTIKNKWNSCPTVQHHKPGTKIYQDICRSILQLMDGTFFKSKALDQDWLDKLSEDYSTKQFTKDEIKETISNLTKYSQDGYWPEDKSNFRNLSTLLYNPRTSKSLFLSTFANPPKSIAETKIIQWPEEGPQKWISEEIYEKLFECNDDLFRRHNSKVLYFCKVLKEYFDDMRYKGFFIQNWGNERELAVEFVKRIGYWELDNPDKILNKNSRYFKEFDDFVMHQSLY